MAKQLVRKNNRCSAFSVLNLMWTISRLCVGISTIENYTREKKSFFFLQTSFSSWYKVLGNEAKKNSFFLIRTLTKAWEINICVFLLQFFSNLRGTSVASLRYNQKSTSRLIVIIKSREWGLLSLSCHSVTAWDNAQLLRNYYVSSQPDEHTYNALCLRK